MASRQVLRVCSRKFHHGTRLSAASSSAMAARRSAAANDGKTLADFITHSGEAINTTQPYPGLTAFTGVPDLMSEEAVPPKSFFIETYGCQMNTADSEIVHSVLAHDGMQVASSAEEADVILVNTCAIRDNAEQKVWNRLDYLRSVKRKRRKGKKSIPTIGVLGCMAERLKDKLLEADKMVDLVAGPDAYKDLPRLISVVDEGGTAVNTMLSLDETYSDITPVRHSSNKLSAYISIMRGCEQYCSYCIVPFTRGKERSRPLESILDEVRQLADEGYKEITLLGQNVNSYNDTTSLNGKRRQLSSDMSAKARGFKNIARKPIDVVNFTELLESCAQEAPNVRFRFTSPHPKDFADSLLEVIRDRPNVCSQIHLPLQSGSTRMLEKMRRGYSKEAFLELAAHIKATIPKIAISTDVITGFCSETEEEHADTLSVMETVRFDQAFMYKYSQREKTHAHRNYPDDIPEEVKQRRLQDIIQVFRSGVEANNKREVFKEHVVLVEGASKRSDDDLSGRSDCNKMVVFPKVIVRDGDKFRVPQKGDYVKVLILSSTSASLRGSAMEFTSLA